MCAVGFYLLHNITVEEKYIKNSEGFTYDTSNESTN